ncbi:MAG: GNAT family N-acetyltransferase [Mangrovicoccus sp.]
MGEFPEILEKDGLILRPMKEIDLPAIIAHLGNSEISQWLAAVPQPFEMAQAEELLEHGQHPGENLRVFDLDHSVIGGLCIGASFWYWLAPKYWRQGLMTRAALLALNAYFAHPAPPLSASCHPKNTASRALLTRLGFSQSPRKRRLFFHGLGKSQNCIDYVMTPEQWHFLNPPQLLAGGVTFRPAQQKDAAEIADLLPRDALPPWPAPEDVPHFIEKFRHRGPDTGLFLLQNELRQSIGLALFNASDLELRFADDRDAREYSETLFERHRAGQLWPR